MVAGSNPAGGSNPSSILRKYHYTYIDLPRLTIWTAQRILDAIKSGVRRVEVTLDLGLSRSTITIEGNSVKIGSCDVKCEDLESLKQGTVYELDPHSCKLVPLEVFRNGKFYKLKAVCEDCAPTLEISGIQMHRTVGITPWKDSELKVRALGRIRGRKVLDICTGLGYTAIWELRLGAQRIVSIEVDDTVLEIARHNPWSKELESPYIEIVLGDACEVLTVMPDSEFDLILHDPPRINIAGELYSLEFYKELYRVLRPGGKLFHYTGEPGKHTNVSYVKGIKSRLEKVGFIGIQWISRARGFIAHKPK